MLYNLLCRFFASSFINSMINSALYDFACSSVKSGFSYIKNLVWKSNEGSFVKSSGLLSFVRPYAFHILVLSAIAIPLISYFRSSGTNVNFNPKITTKLYQGNGNEKMHRDNFRSNEIDDNNEENVHKISNAKFVPEIYKNGKMQSLLNGLIVKDEKKNLCAN